MRMLAGSHPESRGDPRQNIFTQLSLKKTPTKRKEEDLLPKMFVLLQEQFSSPVVHTTPTFV